MDQAGRPFVRDIGSGSDEILRRMAVEAQVQFETARAALLNYGLERSIAADPESEPRDETVLWDSLEGACAELVEDIATTLRYYAAQSDSGPSTRDPVQGGVGARVERLLVCGAFSPIEEFIELLRARLDVEVVPWNPVAAMRCDVEDECQFLLREAGPSMSLAAGLAMRHI
jgi:Tfp pilus assembly PilM family ATPase